MELAPLLKDRVTELQSWDDIKLLSVKVDRLREWYRPGLLCIGDAAHAMSPIGGVGINLTVTRGAMRNARRSSTWAARGHKLQLSTTQH